MGRVLRFERIRPQQVTKILFILSIHVMLESRRQTLSAHPELVEGCHSERSRGI